MPSVESEWWLQRRLTRTWSNGGVVMFDDEPLFLATWEVMTHYRPTESRHR